MTKNHGVPLPIKVRVNDELLRNEKIIEKPNVTELYEILLNTD
jgi:hypothetical protein